jgi:hypothetical protein
MVVIDGRRISLAALLSVLGVALAGVVAWELVPDEQPPAQVVETWHPPGCDGGPRQVTRPMEAGTVLSEQWVVAEPEDDATYDLTGVTSTAYPSRRSPFAVGTDRPAERTCLVGGTVLGAADDGQTWEYYHDEFNAACVTIAALEWLQVRGLRCDNVEDGVRVKESREDADDGRLYVAGTYLSRIRDDCLENDYTIGGTLYDNLWEQCNTGISQRPWGDRSWTSPAEETLVLDHMLIGLYETPHEEDGRIVQGENALFKWSSSANRLVIKCSTFKVDSVSLNGTDAMAIPPGTIVDDAACPDEPSTIVWLGGGDYPAPTGGLRVVTDLGYWTDRVDAWKAEHDVPDVPP